MCENYLPTIFLYASHSGKALIGRYAKSGRFAYYACGTLEKKGSGSCPSRHLNTQFFETLIAERIKDRILTRENLMELARMVNEETDSEMKSFHDELSLISRAAEDVNHRLERIYEAIETGKIGLGDLVVRIRELREPSGATSGQKASN